MLHFHQLIVTFMLRCLFIALSHFLINKLSSLLFFAFLLLIIYIQRLPVCLIYNLCNLHKVSASTCDDAEKISSDWEDE